MPWVCEKCGNLERFEEWGFRIIGERVYVECRRCCADYYVFGKDRDELELIERGRIFEDE
ncbi:hypothetical protein M1N57_00290 [Dehalococcoidales bacterium]|nr:hypothetical protein [Dehalococcoidales bacterium]